MANWIVENGIGEERAFRLGPAGIEEARLHWPGTGPAAGLIADARLMERVGNGGRALVEFPGGIAVLGRNIPRDRSVGASVRMEVTREAIAERGRLKRAQARFTDQPERTAPSLADRLIAEGHHVKRLLQPSPLAEWDDLWLEAEAREVALDGGGLLLAETPAMTLIDVDGGHATAEALASIVARTIRRLDLGGNIGIDFPTVSDRAERKQMDSQLGDFLDDWPHERTAMNGFGFVQIVRRLERPSLLHRIARDPAGAAARLMLRRAELLSGAGRIELSAHPAVIAKLAGPWIAELSRRTGRQVVTKPDAGLAIARPHAQIVAL